MNKVVEFVKDHPLAVGAGIFVVGAIFVVGMAGGGEEESGELQAYNPYYNADANNVLAQMQVQSQVATRVSDNELAGKQSADQSAVAIAKANFDYLSNKDVLSAKTSALAIEEATKVSFKEIEGQNYRHMVTNETERHVSNNALSAAQASFARDTQVAELQAAVENNRINTAGNVQKYIADTGKSIRLSELENERSINATNNNTQLQIAQGNHALDVLRINTDATLKTDQSNKDYMLGIYAQTSNNMLRFAGK